MVKAVKVLIALLMASAGSASALEEEYGLKVLSAKMDVVFLKVPPDLVGGTLTVYDDRGNKVNEIVVEHRKVMVDFFIKKPGEYVIHIEKGGRMENLKYRRA